MGHEVAEDGEKTGGISKMLTMIVGLGLTFCAIGGFMSTLEDPTGPNVTPIMRNNAKRLIELGDRISDEPNSVWNIMAEMTDAFGPRFSGSENLEKAMDWLVKTDNYDSNYNVTQDQLLVPRWIRGKEWAKLQIMDPDGEIKREKSLNMVGLGMSSGTSGAPNGTIDAEVVVLNEPDNTFQELNRVCERSPDEGGVRGKIVLFNNEWIGYGNVGAYRREGAVRAARCGAVAILIRSLAPYSMQNPHTGSSQTAPIPAAAISVEDALLMERVAKRSSTPTMRVQLYMEAKFEADVMSRNLIFDLKGYERTDQFVLISGHIDSWDNAEGSMDDGGGALASWEALRMLRRLNIRPRRTIRAVLWTNEENGARGGNDYALRHRAELPSHSILMECDAGTFNPFRLGFRGNDAARSILNDLSSLLKPIGVDRVG